jgi:hypothetical protein
MKIYGSIPDSTHQLTAPKWSAIPEFPSLSNRSARHDWSFSAAFLEDVQAVRFSQNGGIELRYEGFCQCLGDFRPCEALEWYESPKFFKVLRIDETHYAIRFFRKRDERTESGLSSLAAKKVIFWSCWDKLIIEVKECS